MEISKENSILSKLDLKELKRSKVLIISFVKNIKIPKKWKLYNESGKQKQLINICKNQDIIFIHGNRTTHTYQNIVKKYAKKFFYLNNNDLNLINKNY